MSVGMGGRPRRPGGCRHFRRTSARCHRNSVRGGDQTRAARGARQLARRRREQGTVRGPKLWPRDLATQDLDLVAQDKQLDVPDVQATATANECAQKGPEREVEKRKGHGRRSSQPSRRRGATGLLAPSGPALTLCPYNGAMAGPVRKPRL
jgi:hypothetical protein